MSLEDIELEMETAALMALVDHGVPPDIQELLVHGSKRQGIPPGALRAAVRVLLYPPDRRSCTCHPSDQRPIPCARKFALTECRQAAGLDGAQLPTGM